jgi:hypothetical protein
MHKENPHSASLRILRGEGNAAAGVTAGFALKHRDRYFEANRGRAFDIGKRK